MASNDTLFRVYLLRALGIIGTSEPNVPAGVYPAITAGVAAPVGGGSAGFLSGGNAQVVGSTGTDVIEIEGSMDGKTWVALHTAISADGFYTWTGPVAYVRVVNTGPLNANLNVYLMGNGL
jgi:hypothetical protein